jgi:hypothetical protein
VPLSISGKWKNIWMPGSKRFQRCKFLFTAQIYSYVPQTLPFILNIRIDSSGRIHSFFCESAQITQMIQFSAIRKHTHTHIHSHKISPQALKHTIDIEINGTHATCANKLIPHSFRSETFFSFIFPVCLPLTKHSDGMLCKEDDDRDLDVDDDDTNRKKKNISVEENENMQKVSS